MSAVRAAVQELLDKNAEYAKTFPGTITMAQMRPYLMQEDTVPIGVCKQASSYIRETVFC
jgi:hypothetical protein